LNSKNTFLCRVDIFVHLALYILHLVNFKNRM
jgi:hypothetical protein